MSFNVKSIYRKIEKDMLVEEAVEKFDLKNKIVLEGIIELLQEEGYDIDIYTDKCGKERILKRRLNKVKQNIREPFDTLEKISFGSISDTHMGSVAEQLHMINSFYQEAYDRGITEIFHSGDVVDGNYSDIRKEMRYSNLMFALGFDEQLENLVEWYPEVEGITTRFITGSHDFTHMKNGGADIGNFISKERSDMIYLGGDRAIVMVGENENVPIELFHPGGGVSKSHSYKIQEAINKMGTGVKPRVSLWGHYHKQFYMFYRNIHAFLVPCTCALTGFMERNSIKNENGAYFIDLYVNKDGEVLYMQYDRMDFPKSMEIENAYKTRKKLKITKATN